MTAFSDQLRADAQVIAELRNRVLMLETDNEIMRNKLTLIRDAFRLQKEGKPIPWYFLESVISS